jgi:hypothetical protein
MPQDVTDLAPGPDLDSTLAASVEAFDPLAA